MCIRDRYDGGLWNTPYGKRHTSRSNLRMVSLISWIKAYIHPYLFCTTSTSLQSTPCCVWIPYSYSWILVILQHLTRITTLRHSCFTERRAPLEAWRWKYKRVTLSPKPNAKQRRWRENSYVCKLTNRWQSDIFCVLFWGVFRVEECIELIWHLYKILGWM